MRLYGIPGQSAPASLKLAANIQRRHGERRIPGQSAPASLKPKLDRGPKSDSDCIPGQSAPASLKRTDCRACRCERMNAFRGSLPRPH